MNILIIDDDPGVRNLLADFVAELGHNAISHSNGEDGLSEMGKMDFDLLLLDLQMPGMDGFEVLRQTREISPDCEVIIITAYGSVNSAIQALNMGAYAYINKPFDFLELERIIVRVKELIDLRIAYRRLANERLRSFNLDNLVSSSPTMTAVKQRIVALFDNSSPILLMGEHGSGKLFISRIIHFNGHGKESLIIQLNPEDIETLMEKGTLHHNDGVKLNIDDFPGDLVRQGYGTVIINHINNFFFDLMKNFFHMLTNRLSNSNQDGKYSGFRVIGLYETNVGDPIESKNLDQSLRDYFSEIIAIPPLRERQNCIVPLAQLFLQRHVADKGGRNFYISQPAREFLSLYDWPGNISELKSVTDRVANSSRSRLISADDLQLVQKEYLASSGSKIPDLSDLLTIAEKSLMNKTFREKDTK